MLTLRRLRNKSFVVAIAQCARVHHRPAQRGQLEVHNPNAVCLVLQSLMQSLRIVNQDRDPRSCGSFACAGLFRPSRERGHLLSQLRFSLRGLLALRRQLGLVSLLLGCHLRAGALALGLLHAAPLLLNRRRDRGSTGDRCHRHASPLCHPSRVLPGRSPSFFSSSAMRRLAASSSARMRTASNGSARRAT